MIYKYSKVKLTIFILLIYVLLPIFILYFISLFEPTLVKELYVHVGFVVLLLLVFSVNEYSHKLTLKKSKIIVKSLIFQKEAYYEDICEVKYNKLFRQISLETRSGDRIFLTKLYSDSNEVFEQVVKLIHHVNKQVPQELFSSYTKQS